MVKWERKIGLASKLTDEEKRKFMRLVENLESLLDNHTDQPDANESPSFRRVEDGVIWVTEEDSAREVVASILTDSEGRPLIERNDE